MTFNDIKVIAMPGNTIDFKVDNRSASNVARTIKAGEPVVECTNYVGRIVDDDVGAVTDKLYGIAAEESTETSALNGTCAVTMILPMATILRGNAKTTASANTAALLLALLNDDFPFSASYTPYDTTNEGVITIDEATDDGTNHGLRCIGGSGDAFATLDVIVKPQWLAAGAAA